MVKDYKTMKFSGIRESGYGWRREYECQVCHGVLLDRESANSLSPECFKPVAVAEMTCSLCDETAPLTDQYWMGLTTVQAACWDARGVPVDCVDYGFPSFRRFYRRDGDMDEMTASFDDDDLLVTAGVDGIIIKAPGKQSIRYEFSDRLDAAYPPLFSRRLAREFVDRVRHDLELKYGGAAESGTLAVQGASAEGVEA